MRRRAGHGRSTGSCSSWPEQGRSRHLGLAASVSHAALAFIPALACLFVVGRLTFWIGYLLVPTARVFGMTMTALPTTIACVRRVVPRGAAASH